MFLPVLIALIYAQTSHSLTHVYEEPISDLLVACNACQYQEQFKNRSIHACEKKDPDEDFSYYITPMTTKYSKREFLCVLFLKIADSAVNFKLLFSHAQFEIDAVGKFH